MAAGPDLARRREARRNMMLTGNLFKVIPVVALPMNDIHH